MSKIQNHAQLTAQAEIVLDQIRAMHDSIGHDLDKLIAAIDAVEARIAGLVAASRG